MNSLDGASISGISTERARELLAPYLDIVAECIRYGWSAWRRFGEIAPDLVAPLSKRARASFVYDQIMWKVRERFDALPGVSVQEKGGFFYLELEDGESRAVLRFKKLDEKRRARNYQTTQQILFSLQLQLPGWPADASRLIAGYQLDMSETEIVEMLITLPVGRKVEWYFSIEESESRIIEMPRSPDAQLETEVIATGIQRVSTDDEG